jgi:phosphomannomutase
LRKTYPDYFISKNKVTLKQDVKPEMLLDRLKVIYKDVPLNDTDGLKMEFENGWVHLRQSNTEPIMRIYAEGTTMEQAEKYAGKIIMDISQWAC